MSYMRLTTKVRVKVWGPDDEYLIIPEIQVMSSDGFVEGDTVTVTITKTREGTGD